MVKCTNCRYGMKSCIFDHYQDEAIDCYYCNATDDWLSIKQAEDDAPCDLYVKKLDDNETEE